MANDNYILVIKRGPNQGKGFPLDSALTTVGRYTGNTVIIPDETISRHHARIRKTDEGYSIEDLNSANGLFVNGSRVTAARALKTGDVIRLGESVELLYESAVDDSQLEPVPPSNPKQGITRPISDTGGTVWMKKVDAPVGRAEPRRQTSPWVWVGVVVGVVAIGVVVYLTMFAGR
jgi:pSer/pThr/pTyr-binding forkhead associated (FHA) protein